MNNSIFGRGEVVTSILLRNTYLIYGSSIIHGLLAPGILVIVSETTPSFSPISFSVALLRHTVLDKNKLYDGENCERLRNDFSSSARIVDIYKLCSIMVSTRATCFCYYFLSGTLSRIRNTGPSHYEQTKNGITNDFLLRIWKFNACGMWRHADTKFSARHFPSFYSFVWQNNFIIHGVLVQFALHFRINYANAFMNV